MKCEFCGKYNLTPNESKIMALLPDTQINIARKLDTSRQYVFMKLKKLMTAGIVEKNGKMYNKNSSGGF